MLSTLLNITFPSNQMERVYWLIWCLKSVHATPNEKQIRSRICILLPVILAGYPTKMCQNLKRLSFVSPTQSRDAAASYIVSPGDMKLSVKKIIYLGATESLICSRILMIAQNLDAKSGNTMFDGNANTSHRTPIL